MNAYIICCLFAELYDNSDKYKKRNVFKSLRDHSDPFSMPDNIFEKNYRFPKMLCHHLIQQLKPHDNENSKIAFEFRFMASLNFYTHGSYQKYVGNNRAFPMSQSSVSRAIQKISKLICDVKRNEVRFPQTIDEKTAMKKGFLNKFGIESTIGVVDCRHIDIIAPKKNGKLNALSLYMNTDGYYSVKVEAICDYRMLFTSVNANYPGSCQDSEIWATSLARSNLEANHSQSVPTWLLCDNGYPLEPWLMTPLEETSSANKRRYNILHSNAWNTIEKAFAALRSRFRCLSKHRILRYDHERVSNIVGACFILHNLLIKRGVLTDINMVEELEEPVDSRTRINELKESHLESEAENIRDRYITSLVDDNDA